MPRVRFLYLPYERYVFVYIAQKNSIKFGEINSSILLENLVKYYGIGMCKI